MKSIDSGIDSRPSGFKSATLLLCISCWPDQYIFWRSSQ